MCDVEDKVHDFLMSVSKPLTREAEILTEQAKLEVQQRYVHGEHQLVSLGMDARGEIFMGIQHDTISAASTLCAEPFALHAATMQRATMKMIVTAHKKRADQGSEVHVVNPCGPCREAIFHFFPECHVIMWLRTELRLVPIKALYPKPYKKRIPGKNGEAAITIFEEQSSAPGKETA